MKRGLACFGLAFALAEWTAANLLPPLGIGLAAVLCFAGAVWMRRRRTSVFLVGAAAGFAWLIVFTLWKVVPVRQYAGQTVRCVAVAETDCVLSDYEADRLRGTLHIRQIDGKKVDFKVYCTSFPGSSPGDVVKLTLGLNELPFNAYRLNRMSKGVYLEGRYLDGGTVEGSDSSVRFLMFRLRQKLSDRLQTWLPWDLGGVEAAMLLGDKASLREAESKAFRRAGVSHLLAVSGLHVALLCGLGTDRRRRFDRRVILARGVLVLFYMGLTGMSASVLRAGSVFLIALLGAFFIQPYDLLTATGFAALLMSVRSAYAPCDLGFALSFSAVLGIQAAEVLSGRQRAGWKLPPIILRAIETVQITVLAALGTLPVLLFYGLEVSGAGVLCNLLVIWMIRPALLLGLMVLIMSPLKGPFRLASLMLEAWLRILVGAVRWCAALPFARLVLPRTYTIFTLAVLAALFGVFWYHKKCKWGISAVLLCGAAAAALCVRMEQGVVRIALVGTAGNPCAVITQQEHAVVLFRGGWSNRNAVQQYLYEQGNPKWDLCVDLRQTPTDMEFPVNTLVLQAQETGTDRIGILEDLTLDLTHTNRSNLAVIGAGDSHIAMMAGKLELEHPIQVDVFCAGGAYSDSLQADTILYTEQSPAWINSVGKEILYFSSGTPVITIRPGRSLTFQEVTKCVVQ